MGIIAVIGSLDTKGAEFHLLVELIRARGHQPLVIDTSIIEPPAFRPDIEADQIARAGGSSISELRARADRGEAIRCLAAGAPVLLQKLFLGNKIDAVIGMGGSGGTSIFVAATRALPVGFPKVLVTTLASGDTSNLVGDKDLVLIPSVVDISGFNRISRKIIANAAGAICGMVEARSWKSEAEKPMIAATMLGNTTQAIGTARQILENAGYEVLVFHAIGAGGRTMEGLIADGLFSGVLDLTTTELASELTGSPMSAGPSRMEAAGKTGIPQVIIPGCLDFAIFRHPETVPEKYSGRLFYPWNPEATLMRTDPQENELLGQRIAQKANEASARSAVILPLRGLSLLDIEGGPFWWPEADTALFQSIRRFLKPGIQLIEMERTINDPEFASKAAKTLLEMIEPDVE